MTAIGDPVRVLLVEDEPIIAMLVQSVITRLGFVVVGPIARLDQAMATAATGAFDCAILDVNIRGGNSVPVADLLIERKCPFVMATGYNDLAIPPRLNGRPRLTKPYSIAALETELASLSDHVMAARAA